MNPYHQTSCLMSDSRIWRCIIHKQDMYKIARETADLVCFLLPQVTSGWWTKTVITSEIMRLVVTSLPPQKSEVPITDVIQMTTLHRLNALLALISHLVALTFDACFQRRCAQSRSNLWTDSPCEDGFKWWRHYVPGAMANQNVIKECIVYIGNLRPTRPVIIPCHLRRMHSPDCLAHRLDCGRSNLTRRN